MFWARANVIGDVEVKIEDCKKIIEEVMRVLGAGSSGLYCVETYTPKIARHRLSKVASSIGSSIMLKETTLRGDAPIRQRYKRFAIESYEDYNASTIFHLKRNVN